MLKEILVVIIAIVGNAIIMVVMRHFLFNPKFITGSRGESGTKGIQGFAGPQGWFGVRGKVGAQGSEGTTGITGKPIAIDHNPNSQHNTIWGNSENQPWKQGWKEKVDINSPCIICPPRDPEPLYKPSD